MPPPTTRFVTKRMLAAINRLVIERSGGTVVGRTNLRAGCSLGFVQRIVTNELFGQALYPDLYHQAGAYLFHVVKDHVFLDGNKRTGLAAAITFLEWNGIHLAPLDEDAVFIRIDELAGGPNDPGELIPVLAEWLRTTSMADERDARTLARKLDAVRAAWVAAPDCARTRELLQRSLLAYEIPVDALGQQIAALNAAFETAIAVRTQLLEREASESTPNHPRATPEQIAAIRQAMDTLTDAQARLARVLDEIA